MTDDKGLIQALAGLEDVDQLVKTKLSFRIKPRGRNLHAPDMSYIDRNWWGSQDRKCADSIGHGKVVSYTLANLSTDRVCWHCAGVSASMDSKWVRLIALDPGSKASLLDATAAMTYATAVVNPTSEWPYKELFSLAHDYKTAPHMSERAKELLEMTRVLIYGDRCTTEQLPVPEAEVISTAALVEVFGSSAISRYATVPTSLLSYGSTAMVTLLKAACKVDGFDFTGLLDEFNATMTLPSDVSRAFLDKWEPETEPVTGTIREQVDAVVRHASSVQAKELLARLQTSAEGMRNDEKSLCIYSPSLSRSATYEECNMTEMRLPSSPSIADLSARYPSKMTKEGRLVLVMPKAAAISQEAVAKGAFVRCDIDWMDDEEAINEVATHLNNGITIKDVFAVAVCTMA